MAVGEKIKAIRKEKKVTQKRLSELSGLAEITIRQYEANKYVPKADNLKKIALALDVKLSDLLEPGQTIREYDTDDDVWDIITKQEDGSLIRTIQTGGTNSSFYPSIEQRTILRYYDSLNAKGKKEALKRLEELTLISKYTESKPPTTK